MQPLRSPAQFKYRAGTFLRFQTSMPHLALDLPPEARSSLSAGFDAAAWRWRFHHEGVTSVRSFRDLFQQRPPRKTANLFIARQHDRDCESGRDLQLRHRAQHSDNQRTVCLHIEDSGTIDLARDLTPRARRNRSACMDRIRVSNNQDLSCRSLFVERSDHEMLTKSRNVDTLELTHRRDPARCLRNQFDSGATARFVSGR